MGPGSDNDCQANLAASKTLSDMIDVRKFNVSSSLGRSDKPVAPIRDDVWLVRPNGILASGEDSLSWAYGARHARTKFPPILAIVGPAHGLVHRSNEKTGCCLSHDAPRYSATAAAREVECPPAMHLLRK